MILEIELIREEDFMIRKLLKANEWQNKSS